MSKKGSSLRELFLQFLGPLNVATSCISIKRIWNNGPKNPSSYLVSAESHNSFVYPNDKLDLAIERFLWLHGVRDGYDPKIHNEFLDPEI